MKKIGRNEIIDYTMTSLKNEGLDSFCKEVFVEKDYPALLTAFLDQKFMVINLNRFYNQMDLLGIRIGVSNLNLLQAVEHEIRHFGQYRDVLEQDGSPKTLLNKLSLEHSLHNKERLSDDIFYFSLYHEYDADVYSIFKLLKSREFVERAASKNDLIAFNKFMTSRILNRYEYFSYPIKGLIDSLGRDNLSESDLEIISEFESRMEKPLKNLTDGRRVEEDVLSRLESVKRGKLRSENIIRLIK